MSFLHVSSMAMQGMLASGSHASAGHIAIMALNHADELLKRIME